MDLTTDDIADLIDHANARELADLINSMSAGQYRGALFRIWDRVRREELAGLKGPASTTLPY